MKRLWMVLLISVLSACGTYNAADTLANNDNATTDMARCGVGLGIDNKVGVIIKSEAEKFGGELSAQQSSEIRIKAASEGLLTGDEKKYEAYLRCILELDKRRNDKKTSERLEKIQQPALKIFLDTPKWSTADRFARRVVVENTGEELTELQVTPAPFLFMYELCVMRVATPCRGNFESELQRAYIPILNFYSNVEFRGRYKGELYSIDENSHSIVKDVAEDFINSERAVRVNSMTTQIITLVRVKYKDKFQNSHERFVDISLEQRELPSDMGRAIFAFRDQWIRASMAIDARKVSRQDIGNAWNKTRKTAAGLPEPWLKYVVDLR